MKSFKLFFLTKMLLKSLRLPANTKFALIDTRLNWEVLPRETRNKMCGNGFFQCGVEVNIQDGDAEIQSWTVENGMHVINFKATVTLDGEVIKGKVNCFALGMQNMDQEYLDLFIEELEEKVWDQIHTTDKTENTETE